jgi:hypothetical protein
MDKELQAITKNFSQTGTIFFGGKRNTIKNV